MARTLYALPVDVLRKFDPTLIGTGELDSNEYIGSPDDEELIRARIEGVESAFEDMTGMAYRERRLGSPEDPATWEYHDADFRRYQHGIKVWLDNHPVVPFDHDAGDRIELRRGRDRWVDLTPDTDDWEANYEDGWLRLYRHHLGVAHRAQAWSERNIRVTYRYGALGGSRSRGGQTTLTADVDEAASTLSVANASRLPRSGLLLVTGTSGDEYVRFNTADEQADELTGVTRGVRGTDAVSHTSGDTVHYCPVAIREAVAARAAVELLEYDDWVDQLVEATDGFATNQKVQEWNQEWRTTLGKHTDAKML